VDVAVPVAGVDEPADDKRRGFAGPEPEAPANRAGPLRIPGDRPIRPLKRRRAGVAADVAVDPAPVPHDRRSPAAAAGPVAPENVAGARVGGGKGAVPG